jgi:octaprenyl-diphosphate synthase
VLGKTVGDDFREGKITLPVLIAFAKGTEEERAFWRRTLEDGRQTDDDLSHAVQLLARHEAIAATLQRAEGFARGAQEALAIFPPSELRETLMEVATYTVNRAH